MSARAGAEGAPAHDDRDESYMERLDRNTVELLNELRVASAGIQVLLAFLLVIPFNARFARLTSFERGLYMVTLICIGIAAVLLIGPSVHHRLLFRRREKAYLVATGSLLMILSSIFLAVGLTGIMLLVSEVVIGGAGAIAIGICAAAVVAGIWFGVPLNRRRRLR